MVYYKEDTEIKTYITVQQILPVFTLFVLLSLGNSKLKFNGLVL